MEKRIYEEINTGRALLDFTEPLDYNLLMHYLDIMSARYNFMAVTYIGESILGKGIPMITLGEGEKKIFYVGAHSGGDWLGSIILLKFINEYCEAFKNGENIFNCNVRYLYGTRQLCIIPMLNPDGVDINLNGIESDNILYSRLLSMNGSDNFENWQANARGVTLSCNYKNGFFDYRRYASQNGIISGAPWGYGGEMPESEPEIGYLCTNLRFTPNALAVLSFDGVGEKIFYRHENKASDKSKQVASLIARSCGFALQDENEAITNEGLMGFCIDELNIPAFNIKYANEKEMSLTEQHFSIYTKLREALFRVPISV